MPSARDPVAGDYSSAREASAPDVSVPDAVEALIEGAPVSAHVATAVDDRPHVAPVWYGYRDGRVYFETGGRKLANLRENPRVALSIERAEGASVAWNVTLLGRATVVDDPTRIAWAEGWIYDAYDGADEANDATELDDANDADDADDPSEVDDLRNPHDGDAEDAANGDATSVDAANGDAERVDEEEADDAANGDAEVADEEEADGEYEYALVEVAVGSAAWNVYD